MAGSNHKNHSLSDFKRRTSAYVRRIKRTGQPVVLTVKGKAELVVQDARSYENLLEAMERLETIASLQQGLEEMRAGKGKPAEKVFAQMRRKFKISQTT